LTYIDVLEKFHVFMFSIIIPLYNKANTIGKAIESVLAQTYGNYEIIVVDDGSTDNSCEVVSQYDDKNIRLIRQKNAGVSAARNRGVSESRSEYVAFLDADDFWDTDYLEVQLRLISQYPQCEMYATNYRFIDDTGRISDTIIRNIRFQSDSGIIDNYFEVCASSHVPVWTSATVIRRDAFTRLGGFPIGVKSGEDLITWAKLAINSPVAYHRAPKATYSLGTVDYTNNPVRRQDEWDPVGQELKRLYLENKAKPSANGLRLYISHWHKMRASVAIRFGERTETIKESLVALRYNPSNFKVIPFIILSLLPANIRKKLISIKNA